MPTSPEVPRAWHVYWIELGTARGVRPGKRRPCVVVQAEAFDLESVLVVPLTSRVTREEPFPIRVRVPAGEAGLERESDAMVDQVMAVERRRFRERTGALPDAIREDLRRALVEFLDLGGE